MNTIPFPNDLKNEFYDVTIFENPNIVLDGFY